MDCSSFQSSQNLLAATWEVFLHLPRSSCTRKRRRVSLCSLCEQPKAIESHGKGPRGQDGATWTHSAPVSRTPTISRSFTSHDSAVFDCFPGSLTHDVASELARLFLAIFLIYHPHGRKRSRSLLDYVHSPYTKYCSEEWACGPSFSLPLPPPPSLTLRNMSTLLSHPASRLYNCQRRRNADSATNNPNAFLLSLRGFPDEFCDLHSFGYHKVPHVGKLHQFP